MGPVEHLATVSLGNEAGESTTLSFDSLLSVKKNLAASFQKIIQDRDWLWRAIPAAIHALVQCLYGLSASPHAAPPPQ
jgi:hypothetical protein